MLPKVTALRARFPRITIIVDGGITLEASGLPPGQCPACTTLAVPVLLVNKCLSLCPHATMPPLPHHRSLPARVPAIPP